MAEGWRQPIYRAHGPADGEDWAAVTAAINARMAEQRVGQQELARRSGVSVATLRALQRGGSSRRAQDSTLTAICRALGWSDDYLVRLLVGRPATGSVPDDVLAERVRTIEATLADVLARLAAIETA